MSEIIKLGVVGSPIQHSVSPDIHACFASQYQNAHQDVRQNNSQNNSQSNSQNNNQAIKVTYKRIHATPEEFEATLDHFFAQGGVGLNVTLPHKSAAFHLASEHTLEARLVGVVNTLIKTPQGLKGHNTDGLGFYKDLHNKAGSGCLHKHVVIFGAGGAVKGILPSILEQNPQSLTLINRSLPKVVALAGQIEQWREQLNFTGNVQTFALVDFFQQVESNAFTGENNCALKNLPATLIINATSGLFDAQEYELALNSEKFKDVVHNCVCYDLNYAKRAKPFINWAQKHNAAHAFDGLGMLVEQAALSFQAWCNYLPSTQGALDKLITSNPLLESWHLPPFNRITLEHLQPAVEKCLAEKEALLEQRFDALEAQELPLSWASLAVFYEEVNDKLLRVWSVVNHLNSVTSNEKLRQVANDLELKVNDHFIQELQNTRFRNLLKQLQCSSEADDFDQSQITWCKNLIRDFKLAGAELNADDRRQFAQLENDLTDLSCQFSDAVLDATQAWTLDVAAKDLEGLPQSIILQAQSAYSGTKQGVLRLTLKGPTYSAIMTYCTNQTIRKQTYEAYTTRASEVGPQAGQFDTSQVLSDILQKRQAQAQLLGFTHYAELSLVDKMAESPAEVENFLLNLAYKSKSQAQKEVHELESFAKTQLNMVSINPWDLAFVSEQLKQSRFKLDERLTQEYFPLARVMQGLFDVIDTLFNIQCDFDLSVSTYHNDVQYVELSQNTKPIGGLYLDLFARENKNSGAWMDECRLRRKDKDGNIVLPVAYLVCNFNPPSSDIPSLLTHEDVLTLFHEFGHCSHHLFTQVNLAGVSGIQGVEWDAVEVPSQLFENWCYDTQVLAKLSAHYKTCEPLPYTELKKLIDTKNFQSGLAMLRQIEFSLFDLRVHSLCLSKQANINIQQVIDQVRAEVGVLKVPPWNRFQNSFTHIFAGGYAAGYYGYKWAEVLSADIFTYFQNKGILNSVAGQEYMEQYLCRGGVQPTINNFYDLMGRSPDSSALLKDLAIKEA